MKDVQASTLKNWLPQKLQQASPELLCEWLFVGDKVFTEPFFDDTIAACKSSLGDKRKFKVLSTLGMVQEWSGNLEAIAPAALIFHVSRCGSTLLSQLLNCDERNLVLPEVPFFDDVLRLPFKKMSGSFAVDDCLKAAVKFYGQRRLPQQEYLFIKTDSWHLHFYEQWRRLYPTIPFILLYRNPLDVLLSQRRQRGIQSVPGMVEPDVFGFAKDQPFEPDLNRYMARVLQSYFEKMTEIVKRDANAFAFDYAEGFDKIAKQVYSLLGLSLQKEIEAAFTERLRFHAKHPRQIFSEEKPVVETPAFLEPTVDLYQELQVHRTSKASLS